MALAQGSELKNERNRLLTIYTPKPLLNGAFIEKPLLHFYVMFALLFPAFMVRRAHHERSSGRRQRRARRATLLTLGLDSRFRGNDDISTHAMPLLPSALRMRGTLSLRAVMRFFDLSQVSTTSHTGSVLLAMAASRAASATGAQPATL